MRREKIPHIHLNKEKWIKLITKTRGNIESILESIQRTIGTSANPIFQGANVYAKYIRAINEKNYN